jgi:oxygen tolerance protein BatD
VTGGPRARLHALIGAGLALLLVAHAEAQSVQARLSRSALSVGESVTLEVLVRGGAVRGEPEFDLPPGLEMLGTSRGQNVSWVNGRMSSETVFRYEIGALASGRYQLGPVQVRVGDQAFRSGAMVLAVTAAAQRIPGGGAGPAALDVDVVPSDPYVGQQAILRVRLVQRVPFAEDPEYQPPATTGFWSDRPSAPESFYADEGGERVLVTETRTRIYPLTVGGATVGEATAAVAVAAGGDPRDPLSWLGGRFARREMRIRSRPFTVRVRPLPPGAPPGFQGAVGDFEVDWSADRERTSRDVPITLRLDVRGAGNLPLLRPPVLADPDVEVFASAVDDSLGEPGGGGVGRKRFHWTVLPRREGALTLSAPAFSWFDPASRRYLRAAPMVVTVEVGPAASGRAATAGAFPDVFSAHPVDPRARGPEPWAWTLGGLLLGAAWALARSGAKRPEARAARAQALEWLRAVGTATGPDFWRAADEAAAWLADGGRQVHGLRDQIAGARYGGRAADEEPFRRALVEQISRALPPARVGIGRRVAAALLVVAAAACCVWFGPRGGDARSGRTARAADAAARRGELERARPAWIELWRAGARHPALAARLAWSEVQSGRIGPAALWVLRGQLAGPRDPALAWVAERVREAGGLAGADLPRWPVTRLEWSLAGLVLAAVAAVAWRRRSAALACAALALAAALVYPAQGWLAIHAAQGVVLRAVPLEGGGIELQPGQTVRVTSRDGDRLQVSAGRVASGWVPAGSVSLVRDWS